MSGTQEPTIVSASGKVLLAGGYLVLDQKYSGVVVSTSSRFYTAISSGSPIGTGAIRVRSPQFEGAVWDYDVSATEENDGTVRVVQRESAEKNKFVYIALQQTLALICKIVGAQKLSEVIAYGLDITIVGGNDFYSQRAKLAELKLAPYISSLSQIPPFSPTGVSLRNVHKTGLGSSAALTTSLVGALLLHFGAIPADSIDDLQPNAQTTDANMSTHPGRALTHTAAQLAHCLAQGKVGSGFDVAAAVFGSHRYMRFSQRALAPLMNIEEGGSVGAGVQSLRTALDPGNPIWDYRITPFQLPPGTRLMLADIDAGSDTPSLAGKVLKWRQNAGEEAEVFWNNLAASNDAFAENLLQLSELHKVDPEAYKTTVSQLANIPAAQWSTAASPRISISDVFASSHRWSQDIRAKMREMGKLADVPIEPPEQTALLDACVAQAGVIGGGVPGAGGYDAIWILVLEPHAFSGAESATEEALDSPLYRVENVWVGWRDLDVSPLSATESFERGLRREQVSLVPGLADALRRI